MLFCPSWMVKYSFEIIFGFISCKFYFEIVLCSSGCIWEPRFSRLHAVRFCGASGKQESSFSQMVSQMWNIFSYEPIAAHSSSTQLTADLWEDKHFYCGPLLNLIWHTCFICRVIYTKQRVHNSWMYSHSQQSDSICLYLWHKPGARMNTDG